MTVKFMLSRIWEFIKDAKHPAKVDNSGRLFTVHRKYK
jgi:hypothetical protein